MPNVERIDTLQMKESSETKIFGEDQGVLARILNSCIAEIERVEGGLLGQDHSRLVHPGYMSNLHFEMLPPGQLEVLGERVPEVADLGKEMRRGDDDAELKQNGKKRVEVLGGEDGRSLEDFYSGALVGANHPQDEEICVEQDSLSARSLEDRFFYRYAATFLTESRSPHCESIWTALATRRVPISWLSVGRLSGTNEVPLKVKLDVDAKGGVSKLFKLKIAIDLGKNKVEVFLGFFDSF